MVEIHERVGWPEPLAQFFPSDDAASTFEKQRQYRKRLVLKTDPAPLLAEFSKIQIGFKDPKAEDPELACGVRRGR